MIHEYAPCDLSNRNTFGMEIKCQRLIEYDAEEDLPELARILARTPKWMHIGQGSNLLFTGDYQGTVVHSALDGACVVEMSPTQVVVRASSGERLDDIAAWACAQQWWGLENLSGIPGEVGAAAVQNVGAYGVEVCDVIDAIHAYDLEKRQFEQLKPRDCAYGYRQSMFKSPVFHNRYIIVAVDFRLDVDSRPKLDYPALKIAFIGKDKALITPSMVRQAVIAIRNGKLPDPRHVPNAGSFFRNPVVSTDVYRKIQAENPDLKVPHFQLGDGKVKIPAAWLIEQCGWKGRHRGNAAVWEAQPLVIVNPEGKAAPDEIIALESEIRMSVQERFGIVLEAEVEHVS